MMTTDQRAELDAAVARFPVSLPWFACPTERDGVTGIHGEPHGEPPYQGVAYLADVFGDAAPIVAAMNAVPLLTATIDAQAAEIARLREALAKSEDAMSEMFRYYDGGETRGSYDGKPERAQLRTAWRIARAALNAKDAA